MQLRELLPLARDTVTDPAGSYRRLQSLELRRTELWQALAAVTVVSVVIAELSIMMIRGRGVTPALPILADPFTTALIQFAMLVLLAVAVFWGGRTLGGRGSFDDAILAVAWLQFVLLCLQAVQALAILVLPLMAGLIGLAGIVLFFWMLTALVAEMHGFKSRGRVAAGIFIGLIGLSFAMGLLFMLIGVSLGLAPAEAGNV